MMSMVSSIATLYSFGQDDQNEVQHDFVGHVMPLVLVSALYDIIGTNDFMT